MKEWKSRQKSCAHMPYYRRPGHICQIPCIPPTPGMKLISANSVTKKYLGAFRIPPYTFNSTTDFDMRMISILLESVHIERMISILKPSSLSHRLALGYTIEC